MRNLLVCSICSRLGPCSESVTARASATCKLTSTEKNLALQDELLALRDATAQSYSHAEALKAHWAEIDKAQQGLYQVCRSHPLSWNPHATADS